MTVGALFWAGGGSQRPVGALDVKGHSGAGKGHRPTCVRSNLGTRAGEEGPGGERKDRRGGRGTRRDV